MKLSTYKLLRTFDLMLKQRVSKKEIKPVAAKLKKLGFKVHF